MGLTTRMLTETKRHAKSGMMYLNPHSYFVYFLSKWADGWSSQKSAKDPNSKNPYKFQHIFDQNRVGMVRISNEYVFHMTKFWVNLCTYSSLWIVQNMASQKRQTCKSSHF